MHPKDEGLVQVGDVSCWVGCQARHQPLKVATDDTEVAALSPHAAPCRPRMSASRALGLARAGLGWGGRPPGADSGRLTLGVKRKTIPLVAPFSVRPRMRKMVRTT